MKHLTRQKLTKEYASCTIHLDIPWTCSECIEQILPVNACPLPKRDKTEVSFKTKCFACNGFSSSPRNVRTCKFCEQQVHAKCWNHTLGYINCCEEIIPSFHAYSYELLGYPYSNSHYTQQIGELLKK